MRGALHSLALVLLVLAGAACDPLGLTLPTTRSLEEGAAASLAASSFEMSGSFAETATPGTWKLDLQLERAGLEHLTLQSGTASLEAIVSGGSTYFRGRQFLAEHLGSDAHGQQLAKAAGNSWWKGSPGTLPKLTDFTEGPSMRATFLGPAASQRFDGGTADGQDIVALEGPRAKVFVAAAPPHRLVELVEATGAIIDGLTGADFHYSNFGRDFQISAPTDVVDFSNLNTLPPIYTVVSVDTSGCQSPCVVTAVVRNQGGLQPAAGRSIVTFTMTDPASASTLGTCTASVTSSVGFNQTTLAGCEIPLAGSVPNGAIVSAQVTNPGHA